MVHLFELSLEVTVGIALPVTSWLGGQMWQNKQWLSFKVFKWAFEHRKACLGVLTAKQILWLLFVVMWVTPDTTSDTTGFKQSTHWHWSVLDREIKLQSITDLPWFFCLVTYDFVLFSFKWLCDYKSVSEPNLPLSLLIELLFYSALFCCVISMFFVYDSFS